MEIEKVVGLIILGWLIGAVLLAARLIRRGRKLAKELATRHPETYQALGRPQPGFLQSPRRSQFARFIASRAYRNLGDPELSARFEDYRKAEVRLLISLLVGLLIAGLLVLAVRHVA